MAQVLVTGGTTIVGVAVGAGLTYWFSAITRQHQETREDRTRWYEARLQAYTDLSRAMSAAARRLNRERPEEALEGLWSDTSSALGAIHLVGSQEAFEAAESLVAAASRVLGGNEDVMQVVLALRDFKAAARADLGHPPAGVEAGKVH